jgi:hypothetical protein
MTDIEVYTIAGNKYIISNVSKVVEIIDYLNKIYKLQKINILSNGNILEKTFDITSINFPLCAVINEGLRIIACNYIENRNGNVIDIYDTKSNNILHKYDIHNCYNTFDVYDNLLVYIERSENIINIIDLYHNINSGTIEFRFPGPKYCKIIQEVPVKHILCACGDNTICIYSIDNLSKPIKIYNFMKYKYVSYVFTISSTFNKIAFIIYKIETLNISIIDIKTDKRTIIELNYDDVKTSKNKYNDDNTILLFSPNDNILLACFPLKLIIYNINDKSILYEVNNNSEYDIATIVWHPFDASFIFMNKTNVVDNLDDIEADINIGHINNMNKYYLYKCNIHDKYIHRLNNFKYTLNRKHDNFNPIMFLNIEFELIIHCYNSIIIHKIDDINTIHKRIDERKHIIKVNY